VRDGREAESAASAGAYDVVLLDLGLRARTGLSILKGWRARGLDLPVLIITARDAVSDRVSGLDAGADDYLVKPFDLTSSPRACVRCCAGAPAATPR
jgi:DNA-binding response OmpR family regulator